MWLDGRARRSFVYDLAGTPCENVVGRAFELIESGVRERFPGDNLMTQLGFDSYAAYPLYGSDGIPLGLIAVTSRQPMRNRQLIESVNDTLKGQLDLELHGGRSIEGVGARVAQRILAMTAAIWHNRTTGQPVTRSLIAYDH